MKRHPKINRLKGNTLRSNPYDRYQTPPYALDPVIPYLHGTVWECAAGDGLLSSYLERRSFKVISSDILTGQDFFFWRPEEEFDCIVTNPPYSYKFAWLERCYQLCKPFALLLPVETLGANRAQIMFNKYGIEIIFLNRRVNFINNGSGAWFSVAWFTHDVCADRTT